MKFDCHKPNRKIRWHRWFAWYPVEIGPNDCRWLEFVERRGTLWSGWGDSGWDYEYRSHNG